MICIIKDSIHYTPIITHEVSDGILYRNTRIYVVKITVSSRPVSDRPDRSPTRRRDKKKGATRARFLRSLPRASRRALARNRCRAPLRRTARRTANVPRRRDDSVRRADAAANRSAKKAALASPRTREETFTRYAETLITHSLPSSLANEERFDYWLHPVIRINSGRIEVSRKFLRLLFDKISLSLSLSDCTVIRLIRSYAW